MARSCGSGGSDPFRSCSPSNTGVGDVTLTVTIDGVDTPGTMYGLKERGIYEQTAAVSNSIDNYFYIPLNLTTGTTG